MKRQDSHLSDRELLMAMDGELPQRDASTVHSHLMACWTCRARKLELERAVADFVDVYRDNSVESPASKGPRALLKAQLAQLARTKPSWHETLPGVVTRAGWIAAAAVCCAGLIWFANGNLDVSQRSTRAVTAPNPRITPGAAALVGRGEVCGGFEPNNKEVPVALQRRVFEEFVLLTRA